MKLLSSWATPCAPAAKLRRKRSGRATAASSVSDDRYLGCIAFHNHTGAASGEARASMPKLECAGIETRKGRDRILQTGKRSWGRNPQRSNALLEPWFSDITSVTKSRRLRQRIASNIRCGNSPLPRQAGTVNALYTYNQPSGNWKLRWRSMAVGDVGAKKT